MGVCGRQVATNVFKISLKFNYLSNKLFSRLIVLILSLHGAPEGDRGRDIRSRVSSRFENAIFDKIGDKILSKIVREIYVITVNQGIILLLGEILPFSCRDPYWKTNLIFGKKGFHFELFLFILDLFISIWNRRKI